jgi:hypothetical protein
MRQVSATGAAAPGLTVDELPLALLQIDAQARPLWVDADSVRRRLASPPGEAGDAAPGAWPQSWAVEMQAMAAQFIGQLMGAGAEAASFVWLPPSMPLSLVQLAQFRRLMPAGLPSDPEVLNRAMFARALLDGWQDAPQRCSSARLHLAQLEGHPDRLLLRATGTASPGSVAGSSGLGERTSAKVASAAGRLLRAGRQRGEGGASADELSVAASALTQAPNRKRR